MHQNVVTASYGDDAKKSRVGQVVGFVTSGGCAPGTGDSIAIGMIPREMIVEGAAFEVEILGEVRGMRVI